jgi:hypothetical protein
MALPFFMRKKPLEQGYTKGFKKEEQKMKCELFLSTITD